MSGIFGNQSDVRTKCVIGRVAFCKIAVHATRNAVLACVVLSIVLPVYPVKGIESPFLLAGFFNHGRRLAAVMASRRCEDLKLVESQAKGSVGFLCAVTVSSIQRKESSVSFRSSFATSAAFAVDRKSLEIGSLHGCCSGTDDTANLPVVDQSWQASFPLAVKRSLFIKGYDFPRPKNLSNKIDTPLAWSKAALARAITTRSVGISLIRLAANATFPPFSSIAVYIARLPLLCLCRHWLLADMVVTVPINNRRGVNQ